MNVQVQLQYIFTDAAKISAFDMHPNRPWVAAGTDQGVITIYDYLSRQIVHKYSIQHLEEQERHQQALQTMLERDPSYRGKPSAAKPSAVQRKMGSIVDIKFVDKDTRLMKREIERLSELTPSAPLDITPAWPRLIIAIGENRILAFDFVTFHLRELDLANFDNKTPQCIEIFSRANLIAFGGADGTIYLWDAIGWKLSQKIPSGHSKAIVKMFSYSEENTTSLATLSSDGLYCKLVSKAGGPFSVEAKVEAKSSLEILDAAFHPTELQIQAATDKGLLTRFLQPTTENRLVKMKQTFQYLQFYMHPRFPPNSLLLLPKDARSLYTLTLSNLEDEPIQVLNVGNLPKHADAKVKILAFQVHSMHSHRIAMVTSLGLVVVNIEKQRTPNFALIHGTPSKIYYGTDRTIYTTTSLTSAPSATPQAGASNTQMYSAVQKLSIGGEMELRLSSTQQHMSVLFLEENKYQILSTKTWKVVEEGNASHLVWAQKPGEDRYAIVDSQDNSDKTAKKPAAEDKKRKGTSTTAPTARSLVIRSVPNKVVKVVVEKLDIVSPALFGGLLLGLGGRSDASTLVGESNDTMQFYTWEGEKLGSPLPNPISINWDPTSKYCLFIYEDYFCIFSVRPTFKLLAKISDVVISAIWHNQCLFYSSISADIKCFFVHHYDCQEVLLSTFSREVYESSQLRLDPKNKMGFIGAVSLVEIVDNILVVLDSDFKPSAIKFDSALLYFYCLSHTGKIDEALKWVDKIPTKEHASLARFLEARGNANKILNLDIPFTEKLSILSKNHLFEECVIVVREMVDDCLQAEGSDREFALLQGIKTAQLAARTAPINTNALIEMYKQLARVDVSVYKQLVIHLTANGHTDELTELFQGFVKAKQSNEAKFVAMFLDETLFSDFLRSSTEYAETVQYFWSSDRDFAGQSLEKWNQTLEHSTDITGLHMLPRLSAVEIQAGMGGDRPPSPLPFGV